VYETAEDAWCCQLLEVGARFAESPADALDRSDPEPLADQSVQVDAAGDDVPSRSPDGQVEVVEHFRLDQRQIMSQSVLVRERAAAGEVAVALEAASGNCERLVDEHDRSLGIGCDGDRLDGSGSSCRRRRLGGPERHVGRRDQVAGRDFVEALLARERVPGDARRRPECDDASAGVQDRDPRPGPAERGRIADRDEAQAAATEPVAPDRPRLRMLCGWGGDLRRLELENRGQTRDGGASRRRQIAGRRRRIPHRIRAPST
jgi:hypothetical protein